MLHMGRQLAHGRRFKRGLMTQAANFLELFVHTLVCESHVEPRISMIVRTQSRMQHKVVLGREHI